MKKIALAFAIATGALFSLSAQAAPVPSTASGLQHEVTGDAVQVRHCRWSSGYGCGYGGPRYYGPRYYGHARHWSHRRWGSGGFYFRFGPGHHRHHRGHRW